MSNEKSDKPKEIAQLAGRLFVVGDLHGCALESAVLLEHLQAQEQLSADDLIVFVGDYIDRGPDSRGVVDLMLAIRETYPHTIFLKGNHEDMLLSFLGFDGVMGSSYLYNGGAFTLRSYEVSSDDPEVCLAQMPENHLEFFKALERYVIIEDFIVVHAGLNPLRDLTSQLDEDLFWIRDEFIANIHYFDKTVVFGHTPYQDVMFHRPYKIGIDTGLVYGNKLSCIELTGGTLYQVDNGQRKVKVSSCQLK